jgi:phage/plasmid-like protein (TIGR03299 family)
MLNTLLKQATKSNFNNHEIPEFVGDRSTAQINRGFVQKLVSPTRDVYQVQQIANHDFKAEMQPVFLDTGLEIPNKRIAVNNRTGLTLGNGVVSDTYSPMQPDDLYGLAEHLLDMDNSMAITDVITRSDSHMIGLQINKGSWSPTGEIGDKLENNILLFTTFDGSRPTSLKTISFRPICSNAYGRSKHLFSIRHTSRADEKLAYLRRLLTHVTQEIDQTNHDIQALVAQAMSTSQASSWFSALLLAGKPHLELEGRAKTVHENKLSDFERLLRTGAGHEAGEGTRYAAFNALTNYCTHERATRVTGAKGNQAEIRWDSNFFGSSADFAQAGFNQLVHM